MLLLGARSAAAEPPRRILSLNLCTDQLVLALADRAAIAGVTQLARDCRISTMCAAAREVPEVRGTAEEVIAFHPDLVLAGQTGAGPAVAAARRLGVPVLNLPAATTLDAIGQQITAVAAALDRPGRGAELAAAFAAGLAALPPPPPGPPKVAAIYQPNGFLSGPGTLADAVLARAGLDNFATRQHLGGDGSVPLEFLILHPPDFLVTDQPAAAPSLAEAMLWHPALRDAFTGRRVVVPARDWICGSPATLDAVERLARARIAAQR